MTWCMNGDDLPIRHVDERNVVHDWDYGCESPELFDELKKDPKMDPIYLDESNPVKYELNSYGYRCKDFSEYEEGKFILAIGCSHTYGTGLHNEHIWCNQLGDKFNIPVMNLGNGGFGPDYLSAITSTYSHNNKYPKPAAVVMQWPGKFRRFFSYKDVDNIITLDPTHPEYGNLDTETNRWKRADYTWYFRRYITEDSERIRFNHYNFLTTQKLWKGWDVPVVNFTFDNDYQSAEIINPNMLVIQIEHTGYARDIQHGGWGIHEQVANKLKEKVKKCLNG